MVNNIASLDRIFGALADPTRRRIVERLSRRSLTIGEIAEEFDISQPAISKHVRVLEDSGLLQRRVEGRVHHCALSPAAMESASKWLDKQRAYWTASLDRLDDLLAKAPKKRK
jgi:DNA-binding transcriptional ArsR family regulator